MTTIDLTGKVAFVTRSTRRIWRNELRISPIYAARIASDPWAVSQGRWR